MWLLDRFLLHSTPCLLPDEFFALRFVVMNPASFCNEHPTKYHKSAPIRDSENSRLRLRSIISHILRIFFLFFPRLLSFTRSLWHFISLILSSPWTALSRVRRRRRRRRMFPIPLLKKIIFIARSSNGCGQRNLLRAVTPSPDNHPFFP